MRGRKAKKRVVCRENRKFGEKVGGSRSRDSLRELLPNGESLEKEQKKKRGNFNQGVTRSEERGFRITNKDDLLDNTNTIKCGDDGGKRRGSVDVEGKESWRGKWEQD